MTVIDRPVRRVRVAEVAGPGRITDTTGWVAARDKLDRAVRQALAENNDVELT